MNVSYSKSNLYRLGNDYWALEEKNAEKLDRFGKGQILASGLIRVGVEPE